MSPSLFLRRRNPMQGAPEMPEEIQEMSPEQRIEKSRQLGELIGMYSHNDPWFAWIIARVEEGYLGARTSAPPPLPIDLDVLRERIQKAMRTAEAEILQPLPRKEE